MKGREKKQKEEVASFTLKWEYHGLRCSVVVVTGDAISGLAVLFVEQFQRNRTHLIKHTQRHTRRESVRNRE